MKAKDIRKGNCIVHNKTPFRVMDFHHHTPGNLRAHVQLKLRNLLTGNQIELKVGSTDDLEDADVMTYDATFLYADSEGFHFMNDTNYDQVTFNSDMIGDGKYYLIDQMKVMVMTFNDVPIGVELPKTVILSVEETEPEIKGASVSNVGKPAKTNTGFTVTVPPFIKQGEKIEVSTETGEFMGRAS